MTARTEPRHPRARREIDRGAAGGPARRVTDRTEACNAGLWPGELYDA